VLHGFSVISEHFVVDFDSPSVYILCAKLHRLSRTHNDELSPIFIQSDEQQRRTCSHGNKTFVSTSSLLDSL